MTVRRLLVVVTILAAIAALWTWRNSDGRRIARELDQLTELVAKDGGESPLIGLARARQITGLFASHFEVRAEQLDFSTRDRQQLASFIHGYRRGAERIGVRVFDTSLSIDPRLGRATQHASFRFTGRGPLGSSSETYRVQINWLEEDGEWRIDWVDLLEIVG